MRISAYRVALGAGLIAAAAISAIVLQDRMGVYFQHATTRPGVAATVLRPPRLDDGVHAYANEQPGIHKASLEDPPASGELLSLQAMQLQIEALEAELKSARLVAEIGSKPEPEPKLRSRKPVNKRDQQARESSLIVFSADVESVGIAGIRSGDQFKAQLTSHAIDGQTVTATVLDGPYAASRLVGRVSGRHIRFDRLQPPDGRQLQIAASAAAAGITGRQLARAAGLTVTQAVAAAAVGTAGASGGRFSEQLAAGIVRGGSRASQRIIDDELRRIDLPAGSIITVIID